MLKCPECKEVNVYSDRCIIIYQLLFFTLVLFHGELVFQINLLYVDVFGTLNFLADRQITAHSLLTLYYQSDIDSSSFLF